MTRGWASIKLYYALLSHKLVLWKLAVWSSMSIISQTLSSHKSKGKLWPPPRHWDTVLSSIVAWQWSDNISSLECWRRKLVNLEDFVSKTEQSWIVSKNHNILQIFQSPADSIQGRSREINCGVERGSSTNRTTTCGLLFNSNLRVRKRWSHCSGINVIPKSASHWARNVGEVWWGRDKRRA